MADIEKQVAMKFESNVKDLSKDLVQCKQEILALKDAAKQLDKDFKNGVVSQDEYAAGLLAIEKTSKSLQDDLKILSTRSLKDLQSAFKDLGSTFKDAADTELVAKYKQELLNLSEQGNKLQEAFNNGKISQKEFANAMSALQEKTRGFENEITILSADSFKDLGTAFKSSVLGAKSLGEAFTNGVKVASNALKMLSANPYFLVIALAVMAIKKVFDALKQAIGQSDDASTSLAKAASLLKVPFNLLMKALQPVVVWIGKLADEFTNFANEVIPNAIRKIGEFMEKFSPYAWILKAFSVDVSDLADKIADSVESEMKRSQQVIDMMDKLEDKERQYSKEITANETKIAELRERAGDSEQYSAEQRKTFLEEATRLEIENTEKRKQLVLDRIAIMKLEWSTQEQLNDKQKNELVELENQIQKYDASLADSKRRLGKQIKSINKEIADSNQKLIEQQKQMLKQSQDAVRQLTLTNAKLILDQSKSYTDALNVLNIEENQFLEEQAQKAEDILTKLADPEITAEQRKNLKQQQMLLNQNTDLRLKEYEKQREDLEKHYKDTTDIVKLSEEIQLNLMEEGKNKDLAIAQNEYDEKRASLEASFTAEQKDTAEFEQLKIDLQEEFEKKKQEIEDSYAAEAEAKRKEQAQRQLEVQKEINNARIANMKDGYKKEVETENQRYSEQQAELKQRLADNLITQEEYNQLSEQLNIEHADNLKQLLTDEVDNVIRATSNMLSSVADVFGNIASVFEQEYKNIIDGKDELSESEKSEAIAALERQKQALQAQFVMQQAQALGNALIAASSAAAQSGLGAPIAFAAVLASLTAGIIANITSLKSSLGQIDQQIDEVRNMPSKYATGGYVEGAGSSTSDSIPARLSNGESVINARSTSMFYDLLSRINVAGGGVAFPNAQNSPILRFSSGGVANNNQQMITALKEAIKDVQPVVSVKEITKVQNRIKAKEI